MPTLDASRWLLCLPWMPLAGCYAYLGCLQLVAMPTLDASSWLLCLPWMPLAGCYAGTSGTEAGMDGCWSCVGEQSDPVWGRTVPWNLGKETATAEHHCERHRKHFLSSCNNSSNSIVTVSFTRVIESNTSSDYVQEIYKDCR